MVIRQMMQWRHVLWSPCVGASADDEQLTQKKSAIFGLTLPRNMRLGGTARCDTMLLRILPLTACNTVAMQPPGGAGKVGLKTQMPDPSSQACQPLRGVRASAAV